MDIEPDHPDAAETPENAGRRRAEYWSEFYRSLVAFEEDILERMVQLAESIPPDQKRVVEETNIKPMRLLIEDFRLRHDLWSNRVAEINRASG
jgi:hypothetical protein